MFLDSLRSRGVVLDGVILGLDRDDLLEARERLIDRVHARAGIYYLDDRREVFLTIRLGETHYRIGRVDVRYPSTFAGRSFEAVLVAPYLRRALRAVSAILPEPPEEG